MYGAMTMTVLLTIFTILVAIPPTASIQWASIGIIFIFLFVFGYAWQGCVWLYCAEIAPLEYRHVGAAATAFGEWLMTFITVFAGPIGLTDIGWYFWLWVISGNVVAVIFVYLLCPETGGKTLEQVDFLFTKGALAHLKVGQGLEDEEEQWNVGGKTQTDHIEIRKLAQ